MLQVDVGGPVVGCSVARAPPRLLGKVGVSSSSSSCAFNSGVIGYILGTYADAGLRLFLLGLIGGRCFV